MKLLSVGLARAMWSFDTTELNPGGKDLFARAVPAIVEDYKFRTFPHPGDDFSQGMKFVNGRFVKDDGTVLAINCTLFSDGVVAETYSSTADAEEVLGEILGSLPDLGFDFNPDMVRRKFYVSQLNVKCEKPLSALNPKLVDFANRLSSAVGGTTFNFSAVEFWPDQTLVLKPANFSFQHRINDPHGTDRYWSQAALPTEKHFEFLQEFELLLSE